MNDYQRHSSSSVSKPNYNVWYSLISMKFHVGINGQELVLNTFYLKVTWQQNFIQQTQTSGI